MSYPTHPAAAALLAGAALAIPMAADAQGVRVPSADSATLARLEALGAPPYEGAYRRGATRMPNGRERVAVLISSRDCIGGRDPRFRPAVRAALRLLAAAA